MKKYGIYIAFPPTVNLVGEGLGHHLVELISGAQHRKNAGFVIACPSWQRGDLERLFANANIEKDCYEIISPKKEPLPILLYKKLRAVKNATTGAVSSGEVSPSVKRKLISLRALLTYKMARSNHSTTVFLASVLLFPLSFLYTCVRGLRQTYTRFKCHLKKYVREQIGTHRYFKLKQYFQALFSFRLDAILVTLYRFLLSMETKRMLKKIDQRKDIIAWYCPTPFWSSFNKITGPKLVCIPDVLLSHFPIGFSIALGERGMEVFGNIEQIIKQGQHFITYSEDVKWNTLVSRYHKKPSSVSVIRHGATQLNELIMITGFKDNEASSEFLCRRLFYDALRKMVHINESLFSVHPSFLLKNESKFIFYASQARPNKNILSLLRAYHYLLKKRFIGVKLILTCNPNTIPEIAHFVKEHNLAMDVFFLHRITQKELAACYRLAELAVNPSLSEGGFPFTFTEALSVNTPVVMARIPVTQEIIDAPELQESMLFDPYDWRDMAARIEWGLNNKDELLQIQKPVYEQLAQRTWTHVVDDYINLFDKVSEQYSADKEQFLLEAEST